MSFACLARCSISPCEMGAKKKIHEMLKAAHWRTANALIRLAAFLTRKELGRIPLYQQQFAADFCHAHLPDDSRNFFGKE
jgi:hypothetical protein